MIIALVARLVKSMSSTLEEKGIEREARTLVSITLSSSAAVWSTCRLGIGVSHATYQASHANEHLELDSSSAEHKKLLL